MTRYVAGLAFSRGLGHVALIRKQRPEWQAGKLNGIGGHVEPGESTYEAMVREFREETGVLVEDWNFFAVLYGHGWVVFWYWTKIDLSALGSPTDETVEIVDSELTVPGVIPNLHWIVPMAINDIRGVGRCPFYEINESK